MKNSESDLKLVERCLQGQEDAWQTLIERYQSLIYSVPFSLGFSKSEADDIFGSVCLIVLEKLPTLHQQEKFKSWLLITTRRECWRLHRKSERTTTAADMARNRESTQEEMNYLDLLPDSSAPLYDAQIKHEELEILQKSMAALDERCRKMLELLYFSDGPVSYGVVARELKIVEGAVGPSRARCLKKLAYLMAGMGF
jgi:RNA polymerase sigma factor (sigma-70 family)